MRFRLPIMTLILLAALTAAPPTWAVQQGQIAIAAQIGLSHLPGNLGDTVKDNVGFGANIAYGVLDWLAVEIEATYGKHHQLDKDSDGRLNLDLGQAMIGPRFTWWLKVVELWAAPGVAATVWQGEITYNQTNGDRSKETASGALPSLTGALGLDFYLADSFQLGLSGRIFYGLDRMNLPLRGGDEDFSVIEVQPMVRASFLF